MRKLSNWLLPEWARPDHPLLQYERSHFRRHGGKGGFIVQLSLLSILLGGAAAVYAALVVRPDERGEPHEPLLAERLLSERWFCSC